MPRPRTPLGSYGKIRLRPLHGGQHEAMAWFRDFDGKTRPVTARDTSATKATTKLRAKLAERATPGQDSTITPNTRLTVLSEKWWEQFTQTGKAANTLARYRYTLDTHLLPNMGELAIKECSVGVLTARLKLIRETHGYSTAKLCKSVLSNMFTLAAQHDAAPRNPVRDVFLPPEQRKAVQALTSDQVQQVREAVTGDVAIVVDILLATGCRIGEALALRWEDVDLTPGRESVNITGTVISVPGGAIRQDHTKTRDSMRRIFLPTVAANTLRERQAHHVPAHAKSSAWFMEPGALVFPSATGGAWDPSNFRKRFKAQLRAAGTGLDISPHIFRKTVATLLARSSSISDASAQLGHSSESITENYYIQKLSEAPNNAELLNVYLMA